MNPRTGKRLVLSLVVLVILALLPLNALAKVPTEDEAYSRMIALKTQYPEGMTWTDDNYYDWKGGVFSRGYGCAGFAFLLSDAAFDTLRARKISKPINYDDLRAGDILRINNDSHSVIILRKYADKVVLAEGNFGGKIHWGRELSKSTVLEKTDYYLTRYPLPTHTITFNPNGSSDTMDPQIVKDDEPTRLKANTLTREGYNFVGWSGYYNNKYTEFADQEEVTLNADLTLKARWKKIQCTITYDPNGGEGTMDPFTEDYGYSVLIKRCAFTRTGYRFTEWNTAKDGSGTAYKALDLMPLKEDLTLYAQWEMVTHTIRFLPGRGTGEMADVTVPDGEEYVLPECAFTAPEHMQFSSWSAGKPGEKITVDKDIELTAQWEYIVCTVTFDANGGAGSMDAVTVQHGSSYRLPECSFTPPENQEFDRWDAGAVGTKIAAVTQDITIKALWKDLPGPEKTDLSKAVISGISDQVWTGAEMTPKVTVRLNGETLRQDTDYTVTYSNNVDVGVAAVTVTGIGGYTGTKTVIFRILPAKVASPSLKAGKKALTVKWKAGKGIDGYEIEYSLNKDFSASKTVTVKKAKTTSYGIKKLKSKKTYYVRIRAWKKVNGTKYYSEWSKTLKKKVK